MIKKFNCKCCNLKQFAILKPAILRRKVYQNQYEAIFEVKCKKCEQTNIYLNKISTNSNELRWKELSDIEERSIELDQDIKNIEIKLKSRKKNHQLTKQEEKWFVEKIKNFKNKSKKELDLVKKNYRAKIAIKLKYQNND